MRATPKARQRRHLVRLDLVEPRVRRDHRQRRVCAPETAALPFRGASPRPSSEIRGSSADFRAPAIICPERIDHIAQCVHRYQRRHHHARSQRQRSAADAALHRLLHARRSCRPCPGAGPDIAFRHRAVVGRQSRFLAHLAARTHVRALPTPDRTRIAPGTIGTCAIRRFRIRCRASPETARTPQLASRPKALPPDSTMAWTFGATCPGFSVSSSQEPVAEPRTSTPPTASVPQRITVHPVSASSIRCMAHQDARNVGQSLHNQCLYASIDFVRPNAHTVLDFLKGPIQAIQEFLRAHRPGHAERRPQAPLPRRHHAADGHHRRRQHPDRAADRLFLGRGDGPADGPRAAAIRPDRTSRQCRLRSSWCANWARC